jgi:hypothetical protein
MYVIRAATPDALTVTFSEKVSTEEALRAISQAFALADAGAITNATCDLRAIERGPGNALIIAAALASRMSDSMRVAFIVEPAQRPYVRRIARFTGIRTGLGLFESEDEAKSWLSEAPSLRRRISSTELRHYQELTRQRETAQPARRTPKTSRRTA